MKKQFPFVATYTSANGKVDISSTLDFTKEHEFHATLRDDGVSAPSRMWHGFAKSPLTPDEIRIVDCHSRATQGKTIYILRAVERSSPNLVGKYVGYRYELAAPIAFTSNGNAFMQGFIPGLNGSYVSKIHAELDLLEAYAKKR